MVYLLSWCFENAGGIFFLIKMCRTECSNGPVECTLIDEFETIVVMISDFPVHTVLRLRLLSHYPTYPTFWTICDANDFAKLSFFTLFTLPLTTHIFTKFIHHLLDCMSPNDN